MNLDNVKIMLAVIKSFGKKIPKQQRDDIMQSSMLNCLLYHKEGGKRKFTSSLHQHTVWECRLYLQKQRRERKILRELKQRWCPPPTNDNEILHIKECIELMRVGDKDLIEQYYLRGMSLEEIGKMNGYTKSAAMQFIHLAVERLRKICRKQERCGV